MNARLVFPMVALSCAFGCLSAANAADKKPNILVVMADDVGVWNISAYHRRMMGGRTPNIDPIASSAC